MVDERSFMIFIIFTYLSPLTTGAASVLVDKFSFVTTDLEDGGANPDATPAARNMERTAANFIVAEQKLPSFFSLGVVVLVLSPRINRRIRFP